MVLAPDYRTIALTSEMYRQRFNVAASRAQDQLWLVHSTPLETLGGKDMRRSLLEYMTAADDQTLSSMPEGVPRDERAPGFESLLEQNVFCDLAERAHHVTPQLEINGRRLDLVVTGAGGRVAVECDADTYPLDAEERRAELDREQELKRAGWRFTRVRESSYVLDPERVRQRLDEELTAAGIAPLLADGATPAPARVIDRAPSTSVEEDAAARVADNSAAPVVDDTDVPPMDVIPPSTSSEPTGEPEAPTPSVSINGLSTNEVLALVVDLVIQHEEMSAPVLAGLIGVPKMEARGLLTDLSVAGRLAKAGGPLDPVFSPVAEPRVERPLRTNIPGGPPRSRTSSVPGPRRRPVAPPADFVPSEASRNAQLRRLVEELRSLGAVEPAVSQEVADPERDGAILCIAELFWADGIHSTGGKPVLLELDPEDADIPRLQELGCRVFTTVADLRATMRAELGRSPTQW